MMMKDVHVEKFLLLPFSLGCDSKSSVATAATSVSATAEATTQSRKNKRAERSEQKDEGTKKPSRLRAKKNLGVSQDLYKLIKRLFSRLSKLFEGTEDAEKELEIGFPTDVKHVTHIGLDGCTMINNTFPASKRLSFTEINATQFPSISAEQFERAMADQTSGNGKELVDGNCKRSSST